MRIDPQKISRIKINSGVSLIELVVFIIVVSIASTGLFSVYTNSSFRSADPLIQARALELAQSRLDEILALKYDANTPTGGIPACGATGSGSTCNNTTDLDMNDVDDFHNIVDGPPGYTRTVSVVTANNQKQITVTVAAPANITITLAAFRANF